MSLRTGRALPATRTRAARTQKPKAERREPVPTNKKPLPFAPVRTKRIFEEIADQVRQLMAEGVLGPGDKLPAERELALRFGVSRPALREALRGLEAGGILRLQKGVKGGAYVLKGDPGALSRSLRDVYQLGGLSLDDITEARTILMQAVVALACERINRNALDLLRANLDRLAAMPATISAADRVASGAQFYHLLAQSTGNAALAAMVDAVTAVVLQQVEKSAPRPIPNLVAHRRRLIGYIEKRQAEPAQQEIRQHLRRLHAHLLKESNNRDELQRRQRRTDTQEAAL